jgi:PAS domain S-box-containing protein
VNVLLVDDRPDKLLALESILADTGQNVLSARSGQEALRFLLRNDVAVILLDVNMPQMDGFETATLIRERQRSEKTPIIFLTAVSDAEAYAWRGYSLGAVDYIQMPVPPEVLKAKVAVFVDLFVKTEQVRRQGEWMRAVQEREHEARLAEAANRLDLETRRNRFFTLALDMLAIAGVDGLFRQLNPAWERTLGFSEDELKRGRLTRFLHPEDREDMEANLERIAKGEAVEPFENRHLHRDGSYRWLSWTSAPFPEEGLFYVFARDVTFRRKAEEERLALVREQDARRLAQRENELKDQFLATLSHELRAPLTPILGWTSMLRSGRLDAPAQRRGLDVIERNVRLQVQLIDDLLDVSRIVSGKLRVERRALEMGPVIEAALDSVRAAAAGKRIDLRVELPAVPVLVQADAERLQQVVWNLVSNAIKFTPQGGRVELGLSVAGDEVCLAVSDDGIGIAPDFLPLVFERFRQAETGSSRGHGGLGIGLTIVRHLVEEHGGRLIATSPGLGRGSCFTVFLPRLEEAAEVPAEPAPVALAPDDPGLRRLEGLRILAVDDDAEVREVLNVTLRAQGAQVVTAASALQAFQVLERERPDLIVCDIGLPRTDGYVFMERLRTWTVEDGGAIPALALTAYASRDDAARALAAGFQMHVPKPLAPAIVIDALARLSDRT